jgi:hypothetical protein
LSLRDQRFLLVVAIFLFHHLLIMGYLYRAVKALSKVKISIMCLMKIASSGKDRPPSLTKNVRDASSQTTLFARNDI